MDSQDKMPERIPEKDEQKAVETKAENSAQASGANEAPVKADKKVIKFPLFVIIPAVVVIVALVVLFLFVLHPGKASPSVSWFFWYTS